MSYDCMAPGAEILMGFGLKPIPPDGMKVPAAWLGARGKSDNEQDMVHDVFPNWGTIPGSLRVHPAEDNVYYIQRFGGDTKDGEHIEYWEVDYIDVNADGKITHWEGYNDTMGVDKLFKRVLGKGVDDIGSLENYDKVRAAQDKKREGQK
jgi:hypothetical protein